jgi:trk system potassium uptake protein TrkH
MLISGLDFMTALSAIIACINNAGPGLNLVGPSGNYGALTDLQCWTCIVAMFMGRVEIITIAVLFTPTFWRK